MIHCCWGILKCIWPIKISGNSQNFSPIEISLLSLYKTGQLNSARRNNDSNWMLTAFTHLLQAGAILVFVPGWEQISKLNESIKSVQFFKSGNGIIYWFGRYWCWSRFKPVLDHLCCFDQKTTYSVNAELSANFSSYCRCHHHMEFVIYHYTTNKNNTKQC